MKKFLALALSVVMALSMVACGGETAETTAAPAAETTAAPAAETTAAPEPTVADLEPNTLIGGDNASTGAAAQLYGEAFCAKLEELSGGKITVNYQPNGALGSDMEQEQAMLNGEMDFVICQTAQTTSFVPEVAIFDLPMVFAKYDAATISYALHESEFADALAACYEKAGIKILHFLQGATFRETTSNVAIRSLSDFAGLKIRTMENKNHMAFWSALGAEPTPLTWSEVPVSLQQGLIQAQENATDTCVGASLYDVQDYLITTHHILYCNQLLFSAEKYNSLDARYQAIIDQAAAEAAVEIEAQLTEINATNTQKMVDEGMELIELPAEFIDEVLAVEGVQALYADIDSQVGGGLVAMLQAALAE